MDTDIERWKTAQTAEASHRSHGSHESSFPDVLSQYGITPKTLEGKNVLAVGAGTGIIHGLEIQCNNVAVDPLTSAFSDVLEESTGELITAIGENLPFEDDSFDIVINRNVLDHTVQPGTVLDEIRRVLRPGGKFIFNVNTFRIPRIIRKRLSYIDTPHPHHFSPSEIQTMLVTHGFEIEQQRVEKMNLNLSDPTIKRIIAVTVFRIRKVRIIST
ncbi:class I SAM-dependent methyltransferase [Natrarchaeobius sp. A-rgal3]|uniref:class I SAM-dependent methyltransferase n=1 Tax=Natrarchaeobius versutus TaxID=1679078 RepID=UPI00351019D7